MLQPTVGGGAARCKRPHTRRNSARPLVAHLAWRLLPAMISATLPRAPAAGASPLCLFLARCMGNGCGAQSFRPRATPAAPRSSHAFSQADRHPTRALCRARLEPSTRTAFRDPRLPPNCCTGYRRSAKGYSTPSRLFASRARPFPSLPARVGQRLALHTEAGSSIRYVGRLQDRQRRPRRPCCPPACRSASDYRPHARHFAGSGRQRRRPWQPQRRSCG